MNKLLLIILLLTPGFSQAQGWKNFNDTGYYFTAKYPASWTNKIKENKRVFFTSPSEGKDDAFAENINISVSVNPDFGKKIQIKDVIQEVINNVKTSFLDFKEEARTPLKWNGADAYQIVYTGKSKSDNTIEVRILQRICFYKSRLYLVTYTALKNADAFAATAKQIISTIKFKP